MLALIMSDHDLKRRRDGARESILGAPQTLRPVADHQAPVHQSGYPRSKRRVHVAFSPCSGAPRLSRSESPVKSMTLTSLCDRPERVLAKASVAWEASFAIDLSKRIGSVVDETWIIERIEGGPLRWGLYWSHAIHREPGSAPLKSNA